MNYDKGIEPCHKCGQIPQMYKSVNGRYYMKCPTWKCNRQKTGLRFFSEPSDAVATWNHIQREENKENGNKGTSGNRNV